MFFKLIQRLLTFEIFVQESSKVTLVVAAIFGDVAIAAIICIGVIYFFKYITS